MTAPPLPPSGLNDDVCVFVGLIDPYNSSLPLNIMIDDEICSFRVFPRLLLTGAACSTAAAAASSATVIH